MRIQSQHIFRNFNLSTREWAKWLSEPVYGAKERSECSVAQRCWVSEQREGCKQMNVARDQVALLKRSCLWLETHPIFFPPPSLFDSLWPNVLNWARLEFKSAFQTSNVQFVLSGRVSIEDEKRVCSCETRPQREHIFKNFNRPTREWVKWVSKPVN